MFSSYKKASGLHLIVFCATFGSVLGFWVSQGQNGLIYDTLPNGDRIMDFSSVGYHEGRQPFPSPPIVITLQPSGANDVLQIQQAIAEVSSLPLDQATRLRGAIKLVSGHFNVSGGLFTINASGVVVTGSGTDPDTGTVLVASSDTGSLPLFNITGVGDPQPEGEAANVTRTVPSGTRVVQVDSVACFSVGDQVLVRWPWTAAWIEMMNMSTIWASRLNTVTAVERVIGEINATSKEITLDIPVPFRIDLAYLGGDEVAQIVRFSFEGRIREVGLQDFRAEHPVVAPHGAGTFLNMFVVEDAWVRNVVAVDFGGDPITIAGKRITLQDVQLVRTIPAPPRGPKPADIALQYPGSQVLVTGTSTTGDNEFNFLTRDEVNGPNVFYNCTGTGTARAQPHSQFATGLLYDNVKIESSGIEFINRNTVNSTLRHGIAVGYGVAWHTETDWLTVLMPPGAANWAIGCVARRIIEPDRGSQGYIDPSGIPSMELASLYRAQMRDRERRSEGRGE